MIPRRAVKIKFFLSVVIPVVKGDFVPFSATGEKPAIACVARICVVSPCPVPDTATAQPKNKDFRCVQNRIKIFRSSEKISRLCAGSVVVVCATKTKEAQTWQRNGQTGKATSESGKTDVGKGDIPQGTTPRWSMLS